MADINEILKGGLRFGAVGRVNSKQVDEAANQLIQAGSVTREMLKQIGKDITGDSLLFIDVDVDQMNTLLKKMKKAKVVSEDARQP